MNTGQPKIGLSKDSCSLKTDESACMMSLPQQRGGMCFLIGPVILAMAICRPAPGEQREPIGPRAEVAYTEKNLGNVPMGGMFAYTFEIRNTGDERLYVRIDKKSCSCTTSVVSADSVAPGGTLAFEVGRESNPKEQAGKQTTSVTLATNDPQHALIAFTVKGKYCGPVEVSPASIQFGDVPAGGEAERTFDILLHEQFGKMPIITEVTSSSSSLVVELVNRTVGDGGETLKYRLLLKNIGAATEDLSYLEVHTDSSNFPVVEVPVYFRVVYPVNTRLPRNTLVLGELKAGKQVTKEVELVFNEGVQPDDLTVNTSHPALAAVVLKADAEAPARLRVTLTGQDTPGLLAAYVDLTNKNGLAGRIRIRALIRE